MLQNPVFNIYLMACGVVNIEIIGMQTIPLAPDQTAHFSQATRYWSLVGGVMKSLKILFIHWNVFPALLSSIFERQPHSS